METLEQLSAGYRDRAQRAAQALGRLQRLIYRIGTLRLLLFVAGVAGLIVLRAESWAVLAAVAVVTFVPFLALVTYHNRLFHRKDYLEKEKEVNEQELAALDGDNSAFDDGQTYADPAHLYAFDLDVFGPRSLFQAINRTCTGPGRNRLAAWLGQHLEQKEAIEARQAAVRELAGETDFRQRFRILGLLHKGKAADEGELRAWAATPSTFRSHLALRVLPPAVTLLNAVCLVLVVANVLPGTLWGILWFGCLTLSFCFTGRISRTQAVYGKKLQILQRQDWGRPARGLARHPPAGPPDERPGPAQQLPDVHRAERHLLLGAVANHAHRTLERAARLRPAPLDRRHRRDGRPVLAGYLCLQPSGLHLPRPDGDGRLPPACHRPGASCGLAASR